MCLLLEEREGVSEVITFVSDFFIQVGRVVASVGQGAISTSLAGAIVITTVALGCDVPEKCSVTSLPLPLSTAPTPVGPSLSSPIFPL